MLVNAWLGEARPPGTKLEWQRITPGRGEYLWTGTIGEYTVVCTRATTWTRRKPYLDAVRNAVHSRLVRTGYGTPRIPRLTS